MKISFLVDITGGTLLNTPSISFITQIHTKVDKVNDGDLFITSNSDAIQKAIQRGAFCIISDIDMEIIDTEIAWIKVDSIEKATIKILRFLLANIDLQAYYCDTIHFELLKNLSPDKSKYFFITTPLICIEKIFEVTPNTILLCENKSLLQDIYPKSIPFKNIKHTFLNVTIHSLFETSFSYGDRYYSRLKFSYAYLDYLLDVQDFYSLENIDESKLKSITFMQAIFLNKALQIIDFGKSNRFIITSNNEKIATIDKKFINNFYTYGKIDMVDVENFDEQTIYNIILRSKANCLYLTHTTKEQINKLLQIYSPKEDSLF